MFKIPAAGGQPEAVTKLDRSAGETAHIAPYFLPEGRRFLYVVQNADGKRSGLYVGELGSSLARLLLPGDVPAVYAAPGYLLFLRDGALMAQPFDSTRLEFLGEPSLIVVADRVFNQLGFSASDTGGLTYSIVDRPLTQFQWVGRAGEPQQLVADPGVYYTFDLSADSSRLVYGRTEPGRTSLWVYDMERGVDQRLTAEGSSYADPRWVGDQIVATRWQPQPQAIVRIAPNGKESVLVTSAIATMVDSVSRDGAYLFCTASVASTFWRCRSPSIPSPFPFATLRLAASTRRNSLRIIAGWRTRRRMNRVDSRCGSRGSRRPGNAHWSRPTVACNRSGDRMVASCST